MFIVQDVVPEGVHSSISGCQNRYGRAVHAEALYEGHEPGRISREREHSLKDKARSCSGPV